MSNPTALHQEAIAWHKQKCFAQAEEKYKEALEYSPNNADIWSDLGILYYHTTRYEEALSAIERAVKLAPTKAIYYYRLGLALEKKGEITRSIRAYQQSISLDSKWVDSYISLGSLLVEQGNLTRAETIFKQALELDSKRTEVHYYLGKIFMAQRQTDGAIAAYNKALQLQPTSPVILRDLGSALQAKDNPVINNEAKFYLGHACFYQNDYEQAVIYYQNYLEFQKETGANISGKIIESYLNLIVILYNLDRDEAASKVIGQAIEIYPNSDELGLKVVEFLHISGRVKQGIEVANKLPDSLKSNLYFQRLNLLSLPIVYEREEEIEFFRQRFTEGLETLIQQTSVETPEEKAKALFALGLHTNFYLAYQAKNDLELQTRYGQLLQQVMAANYPEFVQPLSMPPIGENGKIRIGYISNYLYSYHTVTHLFMGWLSNNDREKFSIECYQLGNASDVASSQFIERHSDSFYHLPHQQSLDDNFIRSVAKKILNDRLHVLVFLDIGMHPYMSIFGSLRLAPIQCTTWAHPVTSGLPTIDYFLSSDLMEPPNAEKYYSEQLIRLPKIGISYSKPAIPEPTKSRSEFKLREDAIVYLSCQSLYKYLPQYDFVFAEIAKRVPQAQFAFISNKNQYPTKQFRQRLQRAFDKVGLNSENYCLILPQQYQIDYWNLNLISDVFLDTLQWSGGRSTLEAIACNLPIVTCPGLFMRGRHSYAILQTLGVTETIATNEAEYIDIAVRLGFDRQWRDEIIEKMKQRHSYLYDDKTCVAALEEFYQQIVEAAGR